MLRAPGMGLEGYPGPGCSPCHHPSPFPGDPPLNPHSAPGRQLGLELLQSRLQKEHELNLKGSYHSPLLGTLTYTVPR